MTMISKALSWWVDQGKVDEYILSVILPVLLIGITWWSMSRRKAGHEKVLLPPGPWGLPLIGSLPFLDPDLHSCFAKLALRYGPIMKVLLGSRLCVVFSSPEAAKEVLKEHDVNFADRDISATAFVMSYGYVDIGFSSYGNHWRMLRKLCATELLGHGNLEALYGLRRREVRNMVSMIYSKSGSLTNIGEHVHLAMINIVTSMMWGDTLDEEERRSVTTKFRELVLKMAELLGETNISDFFPRLSQFDIQGQARRMKQIINGCDEIFEIVIDKRNKKGSCENKAHNDFLQLMLQLIDQGDPKTPLKRIHLKALFLDMVIAGTKTTSTTVEWALAELLKHPEILKKAVDELDQVVGQNNMVEESHLTQLSYLAAITKEVLRLHPAVPLLLPHCARESRVINGYWIPKGSKILVNAWAIHRDPTNWSHPLEFKPERFLRSNINWDYKGNNFRYIPFGSGRRICVGISLVEKLLPYLLGSLLHSFNWKLPEGTDLDLSEQFGLELKKKIPLVAIPSPRMSDTGLY